MGAAEEDPHLAQRAEEACLAAWPALRELLLDGWLLRFSGGHTRRANAVNVVGPSRRDADGKLAACEALYAAQGLPALFRLSTAMPQPDLAPALDRAGYGPPEDEALVLRADLAGHRRDPEGATLVEGRPGARWLAASAALGGLDGRAAELRSRILAGLVVPAAFASVEVEGAVASLAFGAVHDGTLCVNGVATAPARRGRGLAGRAVAALMGWAAEGAGAADACLQVGSANAPALALYRRLGFATELSRYHYRRRPEG